VFKHLVPLDKEQHRHLRLSANQPYHFAASEILIPVVSAEISQIAREFPIVFPKDGNGVPMALTGIEPGVNAYVKNTGQWLGRYIPAHVRRYPFQLAEHQASLDDNFGQKQFTIMMEQDAPHLSVSAGERLFTEDGQTAPALEQVKKVLVALQQNFEVTRQQVAQIVEAGLLAEKSLNVRNIRQLSGFQIVDQERFRNINPEKLHALMQSGALMLVYAHFMSLINLQDGWLAKVVESSVPLEPEPSLKDFFDDPTFNFSRFH
jgi:hypothetical protein